MDLYCSCSGTPHRTGKFRDALAFQHMYAALFLMTQPKWGACLTPAEDARHSIAISSPPAAPSTDTSTASMATTDAGLPDASRHVCVDSDQEQVTPAHRGGLGGSGLHDAVPGEGTDDAGNEGGSTLEHTPAMSGGAGSRVGSAAGGTIASSRVTGPGLSRPLCVKKSVCMYGSLSMAAVTMERSERDGSVCGDGGSGITLQYYTFVAQMVDCAQQHGVVSDAIYMVN